MTIIKYAQLDEGIDQLFSPETALAKENVKDLLLNPENAKVEADIQQRFVKFAKQLKKVAPKAKDFIFFSAIFMHSAEGSLINQDTGAPIKDSRGNIVTAEWVVDKRTGSWKWKCSDPNVKPYKNNNGDIFPESELKKAYRKWVGRPLCKDHQSSSVDGIRGIIVDAFYDDKHKRVIGLCALDKVNYPDLARKVASGYARDVSMGTAVGKSICFNCGNVAKVESDYCNCVKTRAAYGEINIDLSPIELSLVVTGADPRAKLRNVIASLNRYSEEKEERIEELMKAGCVTPMELERLDREVADLKNTVKGMLKAATIKPGEGDHIELRNLMSALKEATDENVRTAIQQRIDEITGSSGSPVEVEEPKVTGGGNYPESQMTEINFAEQPDSRYASNNNLNLHIVAINKKLDAMTDALRDLGTSVQNVTKEDQKMSDELMRRAAARRAAVKNAYLQGGGGLNDPQTYPVDPMNDSLRTKGDKQMEGQGMEMGSDGMHPGYDSFGKSEEELKKMLSRAELEQRRIRRQALLVNAEGPTAEVYTNSKGEKGTVANGKWEPIKQSQSNDDDKIDAAIDQYLKEHTKAYFQGGGGLNEPQTYPVDGTNDSLRTKGDKQMEGQGMEPGSDGMHPGYQSTGPDEALKKKLLRADQKLRAKFVMAYKNNEKTIVDKANSRWEIYAGDEKVLQASGKEIYDDELNSNWDFLASKRYGREVLRTIRKEGLSKVAYLLKGAAGPMDMGGAGAPPPMPPAPPAGGGMPEGLDGPGGGPGGPMGAPGGEEDKKDEEKPGGSPKEIIKELTECLTNAEKMLGDLKDSMEKETGDTEATELPSAIEAAKDGEEEGDEEADSDHEKEPDEDEDKDKDDEDKDDEDEDKDKDKDDEDEKDANDVMYALDQNADELAILTDSLESRLAAGNSLRDPITAELYSLSKEVIESNHELCKQAKAAVKAKKEKEEKKAKGKKDKKDEKKGKKDSKKDKKDEKKGKKDEKKGKLPPFMKKDKDEEPVSKSEAMLNSLLQARAAKRREMVREAEDMMGGDEMGGDFMGKVESAIEQIFGKPVDEIKKILSEEGKEAAHGGPVAEQGMFMVNDADTDEFNEADDLASLIDDVEKQSADDISVEEADDMEVTAEDRRAWRQKVAAEVTKKYQQSLSPAVTVDTDMPLFKNFALGDLDTKSDEAVVEGIVEMHDEIMKQVKSVPKVREAMEHLGVMLKTGRISVAQLNDSGALKALAIDPEAAKYFREYFGEGDGDCKTYGNELVKEFEKKKAQASLDDHKARIRRAYDMSLEMQEKGMIGGSRNDLDVQVDEIMKFDARAFESFKKALSKMSKPIKTASSVPALQVGLNSEESNVADASNTLVDQLRTIWK